MEIDVRYVVLASWPEDSAYKLDSYAPGENGKRGSVPFF